MADAPDPDRLKLFSFSVFTQLSGAVTAGMIHLGDRLGLYSALAAADEPVTTAELADRTGLDERWVREWAYNQAAARLLAADTESVPERFHLTPEATAVLATPDHPAFGMGMFHRFPQTMAALEVMPESFRTGIGHDYDSHGPTGSFDSLDISAKRRWRDCPDYRPPNLSRRFRSRLDEWREH